jgi:hypothetical protein
MPRTTWRIAKNQWNANLLPWSGAIAIEEDTEGGDVPAIICYLTRGGDQPDNAKLIASAPGMEAEIARLMAWLEWMSVDDTDAQAALRGDPAPTADTA